ncbi:MAG: hypothetical protein ACPHPL_05815, partial [Flavobacteriaceae bacterium]
MNFFFKIKTLFAVLFLSLSSLGLAQQDVAEIEIVHFSNGPYAAGSSVSVHINPKGIYSFDNEFSLVVSDVGGDFNANTQILASVSEFYTNLLVSNFPDNLLTGDYKLRIIASSGFIAGDIDGTISSGDYGEISVDTPLFNLTENQHTSNISLLSSIEANDITFECLDNEVNPSIGSYTVASGGTTSAISGNDRYIFINSDVSILDDISVRLINIDDGSIQVIQITPNSSGYYFQIPNNLEIGTYNFEISENFESTYYNIMSFSLIWKSNAASLDPQNNFQMCTGEFYTFNISDDYNDGIGRNYRGSYYVIDWGDGSSEEYTHAYVLYSNQFSHIFNSPSCNIEESDNYIVSKKLFNRKNCLDYIENGELISPVNTSEPPVADMIHDNQYCIGEDDDLIITNNTVLGQYGDGGGVGCLTLANYDWEYQLPNSQGNPSGTWIPILSFSEEFDWIQDVNEDGQVDLVVPEDELEDNPGCWKFRLTAT